MRYRQIIVDGSPVGVQGLDEIFADLRRQGCTPQEEGLGSEIVTRLNEDNYIPYGAQELYAVAFVREYAAFLAREEGGSHGRQRRLNWRGYPREQIPWYPTVDEDLCNGCNACLKICSVGALAPTDDGKVQVADPFACVVGCSSCANLCKPGAIIFPAQSILDAYQYKPPWR